MRRTDPIPGGPQHQQPSFFPHTNTNHNHNTSIALFIRLTCVFILFSQHFCVHRYDNAKCIALTRQLGRGLRLRCIASSRHVGHTYMFHKINPEEALQSQPRHAHVHYIAGLHPQPRTMMFLLLCIFVIDPLNAVSLASAVIQIVDFSAKLLLDTSEICKATDGKRKSERALEATTANAGELLADVGKSQA